MFTSRIQTTDVASNYKPININLNNSLLATALNRFRSKITYAETPAFSATHIPQKWFPLLK